MGCLATGCFKGIVFSHGLCSIRFQWLCEDLSAIVKDKASSRQHGNSRSWYSIMEGGLRYRIGPDFQGTLQDFRGWAILGFGW